MYCRFCGKEIGDKDNFCTVCGKPATNTQQTQSAEAKQYTEPDSVAIQLIGKNKEYYIPAFQKLKWDNKYVSWNWPAFLAGPLWLVYRKLYIWAAGFVLVSLLLAVGGASILLYVLAGLFANYVYMKHIEDLTAQAKILTEDEMANFIRKKGGVNVAAVIALAALGVVFIVLIISFIFAIVNTTMYSSHGYYWWN